MHISAKTNIKCLILISAIDKGTSVGNLLKPKKGSKKLNTNADKNHGDIKITEIDCPTFLIHGKSDEVIFISNSYEISKKVKNSNTWFPRKGDHHNIFTRYRRKFFDKINIFIEKVNIFHSNTNDTTDSSILNIDMDNTNMMITQTNLKRSISLKSDQSSLAKLLNYSMKRNRQENDLVLGNEYYKYLRFSNNSKAEEINDETPSIYEWQKCKFINSKFKIKFVIFLK